MPIRVLGIAGSLRKASYNRALLTAAIELAPPEMTIAHFDLAPVPMYDADLDLDGGPAPVQALKQAIRDADALLIATPEYNYGVPGVLKNAIDWASRAAADGVRVLNGKPAAIMGATPGTSGTARAQLALRQSFVFTQTYVVPAPEVLVARCREKFDAEGRLSDEPTRELIGKLLAALLDWTRRLAR
jgi:chromate reductase